MASSFVLGVAQTLHPATSGTSDRRRSRRPRTCRVLDAVRSDLERSETYRACLEQLAAIERALALELPARAPSRRHRLTEGRNPEWLASSPCVDDEPHDQGPRVGEPLPGADEAYVDLAKLIRYALDPSSAHGRHKARVFSSALAIEQRHAEYLRDAILAQLPSCVVTGFRTPSRAEGRSTWEVITAWGIVGGRPELTTTRVASKRRQAGLH